MHIYIASPLGFSEAGRSFYHHTLLPMVQSTGHQILDPWSLTDPQTIARVAALPPGRARQLRYRKLNATIGQRNTAALDRCDAVLAILDGTDVDSGTAAEIGYAAAKGKLVLGYRSDFRLASENEAAAVNLQVEYFIRSTGGAILPTLTALASRLRTLATHPPRPPITRKTLRA